MKHFTQLYVALDETTKTNEKIAAMRSYFEHSTSADSAWAVYFLTGRKPKQLIQAPKLASWAAEEAGVAFWMFQECYEAVGDLAETMALLLPGSGEGSTRSLTSWIEETLLPLRGAPDMVQRQTMTDAWREMTEMERFIWNKLITGAFRVGVSQRLVIRALSLYSGVDSKVIAHRLMGSWEPSAEYFESLVSNDTSSSDISRPYPFFLAHPLQAVPETLGDAAQWQIEWKWDGIRSQIVKRDGEVFIWSRGEELVTDRYPEVASAAMLLPDGTVIDGELLPWKEANVMSFAQLQHRIGRKEVTKKLLEEIPVILMAYDIMEWQAEDIREKPLHERRTILTNALMGIEQPLILREPAGNIQLSLLPSPAVPSCQRVSTQLRISPTVNADSWEEFKKQREESRSLNVEGFMMKRLNSAYGVGRQRGDWWKWENQSLCRRCSNDLCSARKRKASQPVYGLHIRCLGRRQPGPHC